MPCALVSVAVVIMSCTLLGACRGPIDVFRYVGAHMCFAVVTTRVDRVPRQPRALRKIPKPPERPRSAPSRHARGQPSTHLARQLRRSARYATAASIVVMQ